MTIVLKQDLSSFIGEEGGGGRKSNLLKLIRENRWITIKQKKKITLCIYSHRRDVTSEIVYDYRRYANTYA